MKKQTLRVGFDLDGVILYNPARIARPIIAFFKKIFLKRNINRFYYPKNKIEQSIWNLLHKSSIWPAPGLNLLSKLIKQNKLQAYIISGRYESLKKDFDAWINKIDPQRQFSGYYYNEINDQPHLYKEKMIKKLSLDIFVEDNWDIVKHLNQNSKLKTKNCKIFWIYNFLDRNINYQYKFATLKEVVKHLER